MTTNPTVFVVDDDEQARASVCALVCSMGIHAESYASAEEFLLAYDKSWPGCLVTDVRMLGMSGVELQERLVKDGISLPVVVITAFANTRMTVRAMRNGAVTLLEKPCNDQDLWDAIRKALTMDAQNRESQAARQEIRKRLDQLSPGERLVMQRILDGKANKAIAKELDVSVRTVEARRHKIFKKTRTSSVAELVRLALMVEPDEDTGESPAGERLPA